MAIREQSFNAFRAEICIQSVLKEHRYILGAFHEAYLSRFRLIIEIIQYLLTYHVLCLGLEPKANITREFFVNIEHPLK
jgi:hypothetical protein